MRSGGGGSGITPPKRGDGIYFGFADRKCMNLLY
jgi:hypothetical protein